MKKAQLNSYSIYELIEHEFRFAFFAAISWNNCALLPVKCAGNGRKQDNSAYLDRSIDLSSYYVFA